MDISVDAGRRISPMKTAVWAKPKAENGVESQPDRDRIAISQEGQDAIEEAGSDQLEGVLLRTTKEEVMAQLEEGRQAHPLEVNWNATVDPDGSVYAKAYFDSFITQYETARQTIQDYYTPGHEENLTFSNPYNHLVEKYLYSSSPYFQKDMTQAQRDMAFRQERALLLGGELALNDPWALKDSGGVLTNEKMTETARKAAQDMLDQLIADYKKEHGIVD